MCVQGLDRVFPFHRAICLCLLYHKVELHFHPFSILPSFPLVRSMVSYFRNLFGGSNSSSNLQRNPKTHKRSSSTPSAASVNPNLSYIYAVPGTTPSVASQPSHEWSHNHVNAARTNFNGPSPLRYPTYNSNSANSTQPASQQPSMQSKPARMRLYRTTSETPGDRRPSLFQGYTI